MILKMKVFIHSWKILLNLVEWKDGTRGTKLHKDVVGVQESRWRQIPMGITAMLYINAEVQRDSGTVKRG